MSAIENLPPEWAITKAWESIARYRDDAINDIVSLRKALDDVKVYPGFRAFAEYIAEHEEAPVDPLVAEAQKIADFNRINLSAQPRVEDALLRALRRGVAIANSHALKALEQLEDANEAACMARSRETYVRMIEVDNATDQLNALDVARRNARAIIAKARAGA